MSKLVVNDAVAGCDLGRVELQYEANTLSITDDDSTEKSFTVRAFFPDVIEGKVFVDWILDRLAALRDGTVGDEHAFHVWVMQMLEFHSFCPGLDRQRRRRFNLKTLDASDSLQELARMTRMTDRTRHDRLMRFAGQPKRMCPPPST